MNQPYNETRFVELFTNFKPLEIVSDPEEVIKAHQDIFDFMEKLPGTFSFIYDFFNFRYILVSKSWRSVLGHSDDVFSSFENALQYFHPDDKKNIVFIHQELFGYMFKQPVSDFKKLRFDFNYRFRNSQNTYIKLLQQSVFTTILEGRPRYDFSTCTDITVQKKNNRLELTIYKLNGDSVYELVYEYAVPATIGFGISNTEFKILKMASEGLSSKVIAEKTFRSLHTINNHRRSILSKTKSATMAEAVLKVDI